MASLGNDEDVYAKKYRAMKKKLRLLVYEREAFIEELKKAQRKLLKVSRDKSFLMDRLLRYEDPPDSSTSSDSDSTESSDEAESSASLSRDRKRKVANSTLNIGVASGQKLNVGGASGQRVSIGGTSGPRVNVPSAATLDTSPPKKRASTTATKVKQTKQQQPPAGNSQWSSEPTSVAVEQALIPDRLTRQEVERQLELKRIVRPQFMNIDATPSSVPPDDIFSHDNSNSAAEVCEMEGFKIKEEDDDNLVIDMSN